jgi:GNAT superfamily N-acetyltransferase
VSEQLEIRFARDGERAALEALQLRASLIWEEYRDDLLAHPEVVSLTERAIEERRVRVAVDASSGDARAGFAEWVVVCASEWELEGLFVEPAAMRRGIGGRLVQDVFALARAAGVQRVGVIAEPHAAAFYERQGFVRQGDVATRFGPAVRMVGSPGG